MIRIEQKIITGKIVFKMSIYLVFHNLLQKKWQNFNNCFNDFRQILEKWFQIYTYIFFCLWLQIKYKSGVLPKVCMALFLTI